MFVAENNEKIDKLIFVGGAKNIILWLLIIFYSSMYAENDFWKIVMFYVKIITTSV